MENQMTLPDERYNALVLAKELLLDLIDPQKTPRIPSTIRNRARGCLRHYPTKSDLYQLSEAAPHLVAKELEDVQRLMLRYKLKDANDT